MYLLDTDTVSIVFRERHISSPLYLRVISLPQKQVFVSIVTVEELIDGATALIRRERQRCKGTTGFSLLHELLGFLVRFQILPFDDEDLARFLALPPNVRRVGAADCMIGVSAARHGFTVVTRNVRDFDRIPGVIAEDWTAPLK